MSQMGTFNGGGIFPPGSAVQTLTGNSGGAVGPNASNNINVVGDGTTIEVVGSPGSNTLTISAIDAVPSVFVTDSGDAIPAGGVLHISGGTNMNTAGATNVVTVNLDAAITLAASVSSPLYLGSGFGNFNIRLNDSTGATNVNIQNSLGASISTIDSNGNAIFNTVSNNTLQLNANALLSLLTNGNIILEPNGTGKVELSYATPNGVPYFGTSGSILSTAALTNGQLVIGSTSAAPVVSTLTAGSGISISNGAGSITISATGTTTLTYTAINHASSPYTVLTTDDFIGADPTAGTISVLLPNAPATGRVYTIKDATGQAGTNNITVTTVGGSVTIDGGTSFVMNTAYESINVIFNGSAYVVW